MQVARYQAIALLLTGLAGLAFWYALPAWTRTNAEEMLAIGQKSIREGDSASADKLVNQLVVMGYCEHAALLRGEILFRRGLFERAKIEFNRIDATSPLYSQAAVFFGHCDLESGDLSAAEEMFKRALDSEHNDIEAHRGLAEVYSELGAFTRVIEQLEIVAKLDPLDTRPWLFKAGFYADTGNYQESVIAYEEALARSENPDDIGRARIGLAESLLKYGQHLRAQEVLADLPAIYRDTPRVLTLRADALAYSGKYDEARRLITPVVSGKSPSSAALTVAGRIEFEAECLNCAIKYLEIASRDPSQFEARYLLAQALDRVGQKQAGAMLQSQADSIRSELQQLNQLSFVAGSRPWDRTIRERLAEISGKLGKKDIAEKWRRAAKVCPPSTKS